jgi:hypothetical protein
MEVTLPAHLTVLDGYAFASCTSLTDLALPGSVASIGDKAFSGSGLYRVTILNKDCAIFDVYTGGRIAPGSKSVAFSLTMRADDQTLTDEHAEETVRAVLAALRERFGAEMR